jgi:hypothetical protein
LQITDPAQSAHEHASPGAQYPLSGQLTHSGVPWQSTQSHPSVARSQIPSGFPPEHAATLATQDGYVQQFGQ